MFVLVLADGESVTDELVRFVADREIGAAAFTASGAFRSAVLGFFDLDAEEFIEISVCEQAEVLSLTGVLGCDDDGAAALHAHAVLGRRNGGTCGGHLLSATVRPTLEVIAVSPRTHFLLIGYRLATATRTGDSSRSSLGTWRHPSRNAG